jgi:hypothetical protein
MKQRNRWLLATGVSLVTALAGISIFQLTLRESTPPEGGGGTASRTSHKAPSSEAAQVQTRNIGDGDNERNAVINSIDVAAPWSQYFREKSAEEEMASFRKFDPHQTLHNLESILEAAKSGSPQASYAIYELIRYCEQEMLKASPGRKSEFSQSCEKFSIGLAHKKFDLLIKAASEGVPEAAFAAFSEARQISDRGETSSSNQLPQIALASLEKLASTAGSLRAVGLLGKHYEAGGISNQDLTKSLAYYQIYAQATGDPEFLERAKIVRSQLREGDLIRVQEIQREILRQLGQ